MSTLKPKILLLLWHPRESRAGGFVRIKEFIPYFTDFTVRVIDNEQSILRGFVKKENIIEYTIPSWVLSLYKIRFEFGRIVEWIYVTYILIKLGKKELRKDDCQIIYGTTGEHFHIFIASIILKRLFSRSKLVLDILNFEIPNGLTNYFLDIYHSGVGLFRTVLSVSGVYVSLTTERWFLRNCDFIVTVSPHIKQIISNYYPKERIIYTPSGVSFPKSYIHKTVNPRKKFDGIYIGRMTPEKGIFDLIKVWQEICKIKKNAKLNLIGFVDPVLKKKLSSEIAKAALKDNIILSGALSDKDKEKDLMISQVFIHLAYFEPLVPVITILEALASGIPVVTYYVKAFNDYPAISDNPAIFVIENKNIDKASEAILHVLSLPKREKMKIGEKAKKFAKKFSWSEIVKIEIKVFKQLAKELNERNER